MTNETLGQRLGVSPSMVSRIKSGHRLPSTKTLNRIHEELGIPLEDLMRAHGQGCGAFGVLVREALDKQPQAA